ncbi:hypothetical protein NE647_10000 [Blautia coccoides]|nr:hypothetical protein [Blautia coccoides]MCQ4640761.1 hypothetical protein [Blautia coccoides]
MSETNILLALMEEVSTRIIQDECRNHVNLNKQEVKYSVKSLELLDYLSTKAGCMYMSDLHQAKNFLAVHHALRELSPDAFAVKEWNDAVWYITGEQHDFGSSDEAEKYLAEYIMNKGNY